MAAEQNIDAERAAFEAWHRSRFATKHSTGQPTRDMHNGVYAEDYGPENQQQMWEAWQAARRAAQPESATGTTGAIQSIDTPEFEKLANRYRVSVAFNRDEHYSALIAHIDAIIGDLRAQLALKSQEGVVTPEDAIAFGASLLGFASETDSLDGYEAIEWARSRWPEWRK